MGTPVIPDDERWYALAKALAEQVGACVTIQACVAGACRVITTACPLLEGPDDG